MSPRLHVQTINQIPVGRQDCKPLISIYYENSIQIVKKSRVDWREKTHQNVGFSPKVLWFGQSPGGRRVLKGRGSSGNGHRGWKSWLKQAFQQHLLSAPVRPTTPECIRHSPTLPAAALLSIATDKQEIACNSGGLLGLQFRSHFGVARTAQELR
jgi:hypothetical protein